MLGKKTLILVALIVLIATVKSLAQSIEKIEPPHWYAGMQNNMLQLIIYGERVAEFDPSIDSKYVAITKVHRVLNSDYLFIDLMLSVNIPADTYRINMSLKGNKINHIDYSIKARKLNSANRSSFSSADVVYLITPDRFANGDTSNDVVEGMKENNVDRANDSARHGGDIKGIIDRLDYIADMGFTSIWINPLLENDMPKYSYHGYATTDYYKIDSRFGTNEDYVTLCAEAKKRGLGIIMDQIANHCGSEHWWIANPPTSDWIHYQDKEYQQTNHKKSTQLDPYAAPQDKTIFTDGWFVPTMPDLNQKKSLLSTYLIQNSIWWIEYADLHGIRQDTYSYPDKNFMTAWTCAIDREYPNFNIVGEEWVEDPALISYWQAGKENSDGYTSCLKSLMDFTLNSVLVEAIQEPEEWDKGLVKLYENLAKDHHYSDPMSLMVFADNHDMSRLYTQVNEDVDQFKMAMIYLLTVRGIPQIYYGTEILMSHPHSDSHGAIREDFPGGWKSDTIEGFTGEGLSPEAKETQAWLRNLLQWRKQNKIIHHGKLMHYNPQNGVYVYFRYLDNKKIMVVINKNDNQTSLSLSRFSNMIGSSSEAIDIANNNFKYELSNEILLPAKQGIILEIKD